MNAYVDWCAECGKPLERLAHGAYARCCFGLGYQSRQAPLPRDAWATAGKTRQGLWFYPHPARCGR
jgi:hypothetical protein